MDITNCHIARLIFSALFQEVDVYLPDNVDLRGECDEDYSSLAMTFKAFDLKIFFRKVR